MSRIYLVRHGRPSAVWGGTEDDPGLDNEGLAQAGRAARYLLNLPASERPTWVVSSPMRRCLETARPLARALATELEVTEAVGEIPTPRRQIDRGVWLRRSLQGRWSEIQGEIDYQSWREGVLAAVNERPRAAIYTHFVAINAVVSGLAGVDEVTVFRPGHASITVLEADRDELRIIGLGAEAATGVL